MQKPNPNHNKSVGENCVFPHSRGITLIALIITIIVMIILVGVTVNVALNGGLFSTAKKAAYQTEVSTIQEQLEAEKVIEIAENDGNIPSDFGITMDDLPISDELKTKYGTKLVISSDGNLYYNPEEVTDEEERAWLEEIGINAYTGEDEALSLLEKYFLGVDGAGRNMMGDILDTSDMTFKAYDQIEESPENDLEFLNYGAADTIKEGDKYYGIADFYVKYENEGYRIRTHMDLENQNEFITKSVEKVYTPQGREGQKYAYDIDGDGTEEECTILYDYGVGQGIEIVAPTVVGADLKLGYGDTTIDWEDPEVIAVADMDESGTLENIEKSIYSYNNAIKTINDYAKEQVTNPDIPKENIRSVGSNLDNPYSENTTPYTSTNLANWAEGKYNGVGYSTDENYEQDLIRMSYHKVANISEYYWLASRVVRAGPGDVNFGVRSVSSDGIFNGNSLWGVDSSGSADGNSYSNGVRPVIKIPNV